MKTKINIYSLASIAITGTDTHTQTHTHFTHAHMPSGDASQESERLTPPNRELAGNFVGTFAATYVEPEPE